MKLDIKQIIENETLSFSEKVNEIEKFLILDSLIRNRWIKYHAAIDLKTSYRVFNYKCRKYGLEKKILKMSFENQNCVNMPEVNDIRIINN